MAVRRILGASGRYEKETATAWTTPWAWRDADGLYVGWNRQAWLYWELDLHPIAWEDGPARLDAAQALQSILAELGGLDPDQSMGLEMLASQREVHVVSIRWEEVGRPSPDAPPALADFQAACLDFLIPRRAVLIGVRLHPEAVSAPRDGKARGVVRQLFEATASLLADDVPDRDRFEADRRRVEEVLRRHGAKPPSEESLAQLESWYNLGRGPDALLQVADDSIFVSDFDRIQLMAAAAFDRPVMHAPHSTWVYDAETHPESPDVVSIRAVLQPPSVARARARRAQRRIRAQIEEEMATGDIERIEDSVAYQQASETEQFIALRREPLLANCSIVFARRIGDEIGETFADMLHQVYGIEVRPLLLRQLEALEETLPCSSKRVNPFLQDLSISMVAHSGVQGWSQLGDRSGLFVGLSHPDLAPVWLDPEAAPRENAPASMAVFGDSGSGKTYTLQLLAAQAVLAGYPVVFINPKGFSTLAPLTRLVGGTVLKMSRLSAGSRGFFDPFGYADPEVAAEIAAQYLLDVVGNAVTPEAEIRLGAALKRAARAGARTVGEALAHADPEVAGLVRDQVEASSMFAVGVADAPSEERLGASGGLVLIEFDRKLDLPEPGKSPDHLSRAERIALAVVRLVTRVSMEVLAKAGAGMLVVDEAWTFLSSPTALAVLQQLGREGRSLNILPVFATQRVDDLIKQGVDMESHLSRVLVMKLSEEREARAALTLCGLEPTRERVEWLRQAGPRGAEAGRPGRPAMGIHRDLRGRHSALYIGPVPPEAHEAFTTNPQERARLDASAEQAP